MSVNVELRWVNLHLAGQNLYDSSNWGRILYMEKKKGKNTGCLGMPKHAKTVTKQCRTHRAVCVVREELHLQNLFLLNSSTQKGREEQHRFQDPQQVCTVSQHALNTAGQHSHPDTPCLINVCSHIHREDLYPQVYQSVVKEQLHLMNH